MAKEKAENIFYNEFSPALMIRFGSLSMEQGGSGCIELRVAENYAKENGMWLPISEKTTTVICM